MAIEISKNSNEQTWRGSKILIAGDSGCGKTTLAAQDEKPLFLCFEQGLAQLPVDFINVRSADDLLETVDYLRDLVKNKKFDYTSVVIDGIDDYLVVIDELVMKWAHSKYKKEVMDDVQGIGDIPQGNGWARQRLYCMYYIKELSYLPCALVVLSHTKSVTLGNGANAYQKIKLNAPSDRLGNAIMGFMDHLIVIRTTVRGNSKVRYLNASDRMDCIGKSRGSDGKEPKPLVKDGTVLTDVPKENFDKIRSLFV
jgi:hypothetical protein